MIQCLKGHHFPEMLSECPVCARENELRTIFSGPIHHETHDNPVLSHGSNSALYSEQVSDISKTMILDVNSNAKKVNLAGWLIMLDDDDIAINSYNLYNKIMTIGRAKTNDIILQDDAVSGFHCSIEIQNGKFMITDLGSSNKTIVDGTHVTSTCLEELSIIKIGRFHFKIRYL
jgi:hypothetical protein